MLHIYHWKIFTLYCFNTKVSVEYYHKGWQFNCHIITGRNFKHLSLENVYLISFSTRISVRLYQKGKQFSCHLIRVRNVNNL